MQTTGYTAAYLTLGRELRTLEDVNNDLRAIIDNENFIPQVTPCLKKLDEVIISAKEAECRQQDTNKQMYDAKHRG